MRWYTAIGMKTVRGDGKFYVKTDGEEKMLTDMEAYLWCALLWSIVPEDTIYKRMRKILCLTFPGENKGGDQEEFRYCLRRLCTRGLVAWVETESKKEAEINLFKEALVETRLSSFRERLSMFLVSLISGYGVPLSLRALRGDPLKKQNKNLLNNLREYGEIAVYLEDIRKDGLDSGKNNTEIIDLQRKFISDIAELHNKKVLLIKTVKKEGYEI